MELSRHIVSFAKKNHGRRITPQNTLCLFCQPRGGSTWLAELLMYLPNSVLIDEPLWRGKMLQPFKNPNPADRKVPRIAELNFFYNQPIPENAHWPEARDVFEDIISGRVPSLGLYEEQDLRRLRHGSFYITKFNYANMLMPWLIKQFDFNSIVLTRHPCAVVASQLKHRQWQDLSIPINGILPNFPFQDMYLSAIQKVGKIDSRTKYLALIWAMGFKNTVMHPKNNNQNWLIISYEGLVSNPLLEIDRIKNQFSYPLHESIIEFKKPSKSTGIGSLQNLRSGRQISLWKKTLSTKQKIIIFDVLEKMEIDLYTENTEPDYSRLYFKLAKP